MDKLFMDMLNALVIVSVAIIIVAAIGWMFMSINLWAALLVTLTMIFASIAMGIIIVAKKIVKESEEEA